MCMLCLFIGLHTEGRKVVILSHSPLHHQWRGSPKKNIFICSACQNNGSPESWFDSINSPAFRIQCLSLSKKLYITWKFTFQGFKWAIVRTQRWLFVSRATKKIACPKTAIWSIKNFVYSNDLFYASLERICSQLSFDALLVNIGWKTAKLTFNQTRPIYRVWVTVKKSRSRRSSEWSSRRPNLSEC